MTLEICKTKNEEIGTEKKQQQQKPAVGFTDEQLEILREEHLENLGKDESSQEEFEEQVTEYQKKHHTSRQDAVTNILRNNMQY